MDIQRGHNNLSIIKESNSDVGQQDKTENLLAKNNSEKSTSLNNINIQENYDA